MMVCEGHLMVQPFSSLLIRLTASPATAAGAVLDSTFNANIVMKKETCLPQEIPEIP